MKEKAVKSIHGLRALFPVLFVALLLTGCATDEPHPGGLLVQKEIFVPGPSEELYGTWVNPELKPPVFYPKQVIHPWGLFEVFQTMTSTTYAWRGITTIVEKWTDADGTIWYKEFVRCSLKGFYTGHVFCLDRLGKDGRTVESISSNLGWPGQAEMDPETNATYVKYVRQD